MLMSMLILVHVYEIHFFFFNDTATTEIYTLSLHDALPISGRGRRRAEPARHGPAAHGPRRADRKSTRLNSSHGYISYAVFCLKKKINNLVAILIFLFGAAQPVNTVNWHPFAPNQYSAILPR